MAYCLSEDVQRLVVHLTLTADTDPSLTDVDTWIDDITEEMNGVLVTADYSANITEPASAKILKNLCAHAVAAMVLNASQFGIEPAKSEQAEQYWEIYQEGLRRIATMPNYLHDAATTGVGGGARPRSFATDNTDDAPEPSFTRDMDF